MNNANVAVDSPANIYETYFAVAMNVMLFIPAFDEATVLQHLMVVRSAYLMKRLAGAWECLIIYDSLIFGLILHKILRDRTRLPTIGLNRLSLRSLLLRDAPPNLSLAASSANLARLSVYAILQVRVKLNDILHLKLTVA
ncbi:hypothetical protein CVT25_015656 [Psilocybe cyanescens]|uniref:Uncharacterized protein n=1 Tax=Psilocybe cyanescens TaxID=93625 RepID=A0A409WI23_PSICY|nr:hypothetical protein CVT25_015656 [Psilocybe cyanescens]